MKIGPLTPSRRAQPLRKVRSPLKGGPYPFASEAPAEAEGVAPSSPAEALIGLQTTNETSPELTALEKGEQTLDLLKNLQLSLLSGQWSRDQLQRLLEAVHQQGDSTKDAALRSILEEISLRAQVELAKYRS
ncbi:MAG: flagellar assembly protein FliX [Holosporales bacterium]|jgi:hypothetical protein|nr:flagellar assembly protein FliX [Holosporales bacterium]